MAKKLRVLFQRGDFDPRDIPKEGFHHLGCDGIVFVAITRGPQAHAGPAMDSVGSFDATTGSAVIPSELYRTWISIANALMEEKGLANWQRQIVAKAFQDTVHQITVLKEKYKS